MKGIKGITKGNGEMRELKNGTQAGSQVIMYPQVKVFVEPHLAQVPALAT